MRVMREFLFLIGHVSDSQQIPISSVSDYQIQSHHLTALLEQLSLYASKWRDIGRSLGFTPRELDKIQASKILISNAPNSWLQRMLSDWLEWAPGDIRGSTHVATLGRLREALILAGLAVTAHDLYV